ncbi:DNA ligase D [Halobacillus sp. H74]|uniref:DNA ligase D n=1 Tax=Halobacillus sp. H74 TaxID=3457436 RepID=UPI003FCE9971
MKPMLLSSTAELPKGKEWIYEMKYDGFRAILEVTPSDIKLWSRNGKDLSAHFPEITNWKFPESCLPLKIDGEIVILNTLYQANFPLLQIRGRIRNKEKIQRHAAERPATLLAFDILEDLKSPLSNRKQRLRTVLEEISHPHIREIETFTNHEEIQEKALLHLAEGIAAKSISSSYRPGERVQHWLKWKQWRSVSGFLISYDPENGYYDAATENNQTKELLGRFKHGLSGEESKTLRNFFKDKGYKKKGKWHLEPSICVDIHCLNAQGGDLREPYFHQFRFDLSPAECTSEKLEWDLAIFPDDFEPTHTSKKLWPEVTKEDYLLYIRKVAPYILPFISNKKLTLIRYPDGIDQESFFQKHYPDHAPGFLKEWTENAEKFMMCNNLSSLVWLANQGALEFHIPFEKAGAASPDEIVLDLDPPDRDHFHLAVTASRLLKHVLDELEVVSFIKTSGNKGMQIHIPIKEGDFSYEETRQITEALAALLVNQEPELFTTERLKKNRGGRLYIDYVQHAEGKTIIAPYSTRATDRASVAAPLYWSEVKECLTPETFNIHSIIERVHQKGCPFREYENARDKQPVSKLKKLIQ